MIDELWKARQQNKQPHISHNAYVRYLTSQTSNILLILIVPAIPLVRDAEHPHTTRVRKDSTEPGDTISTTPDLAKHITLAAKGIPKKRICNTEW